MKLDSHQHFWIYKKMLNKTWINDAMSLLRRDYLPPELKMDMVKNNFDGSIVIQTDQTEVETHYLLGLSEQYNYIKGIVGWVDFQSKNINKRLEYFSRYKKLKGFRHIVQAEENDFLLQKDFCRGISFLKDYSFTYDILIYPQHLRFVRRFVDKFPDQKFVINHIAKPDIENQSIDRWKKDLKVFSGYKNVYCKIAGLVTEADQKKWRISDFTPYITIVLDIFGIDRVMFGSDWPVCLPSATYSQVCGILEKNTEFLNDEERKKLWGRNCFDFYNL